MEAIRTGKQSVVTPALQAGDRYRVGAGLGDGSLARLPTFPATVRIDRDGGLLSHLNVWQNLILPLEYHVRDAAHALEDASLLFMLCGEDRKHLPQLMASFPDALTLYEKRLAGFVRALLLEPEVLVLDEGLSDDLLAAEREKVSQWAHVFRMRFPFRELLHGARRGNALGDLEHRA